MFTVQYSVLLRGAIVILSALVTGAVNAKTIYVSSSSPNASDSNSGSDINSPIKSLMMASGKVVSGDVLLLKSGDLFTLSDRISIDASGIVIGSYGGEERPIIDGEMKIPSAQYSGLLRVNGSGIAISDIEIRNSNGRGITADGSNIEISNVKINQTYDAGILLTRVNGARVVNNEVTRSNWGYKYSTLHPWGGAISFKGSSNYVADSNYVHEGWGEGIASWYGSNKGVVSNNKIYSQHAIGIYIEAGLDIEVFDNKVYGSTNSLYHRGADFVGSGIALNNEKSRFLDGQLDDSQVTSYVKIYNNLVVFCEAGISVWGQYDGTFYKDLFVFNNTFVDNKVQFTSSGTKRFQNSHFFNNIFLSISDKAADIGSSLSVSGVRFSNNFWTTRPQYESMQSGADIYSGLRLNDMSDKTTISSINQYRLEDFMPVQGASVYGAGLSSLGSAGMSSDTELGGKNVILTNIGASLGENAAVPAPSLPPTLIMDDGGVL